MAFSHTHAVIYDQFMQYDRKLLDRSEEAQTSKDNVRQNKEIGQDSHIHENSAKRRDRSTNFNV